ncbi:MAG: site-2 protease family protein [Candidatus Omnitrophica bacterium]|nr:site-2 protease family protein [Candidatus Omnitrophota bacterium]
MGLLSLLLHNPVAFIILAFPLLYSVIAHELAHGVVAGWFGDTTAKDAGRLSLNPFNHLDPMGTLMLFVAGFGWAKPVPVNYYALKNSRAAFVAVSLAGCLTNILIATVALFLLQFPSILGNQAAVTILSVVARINIILGAFNLIPIPPLDGSKVLMGFLPPDIQRSFAAFEPYGFFVIIILLFTGFLYPIIDFIQNIIYRLIALLFGIF